MDRWQQELALAAGEWGDIVRFRDLRALGLSRDECLGAVEGLTRIRRGTYLVRPQAVDGPAPTDPHEARGQRHIAALQAVLADRPDTVASHTSAALLHGLPLSPGDLDVIHVTLAAGASRGGFRHGVHTHVRTVPPGGVVEVAGLRVTMRERTVIDCARLLPLPGGLSIADAALHNDFVQRVGLISEIGSHRRAKGIATARRVVELVDGRAESPGESRTRLILIEAGFGVAPQVEIHDDRGEFLGRVDLGIRGSRVIVEFDGRAKFGMKGDVEAAHWAAKRRRDGLEEAGFAVVTVVWADLGDPVDVVARVERALRRTGADPEALRRQEARRRGRFGW